MVAGFILGASREAILVPATGYVAGNLLEAGLMLLAISAGASFVTRWFRVPAALHDRLGMGLCSLALVLSAEVALSPLVHGSVAAWVAKFTPLSLTITGLLWAAQAVAPAVLAMGLRR
jgi:hypothetical protein